MHVWFAAGVKYITVWCNYLPYQVLCYITAKERRHFLKEHMTYSLDIKPKYNPAYVQINFTILAKTST